MKLSSAAVPAAALSASRPNSRDYRDSGATSPPPRRNAIPRVRRCSARPTVRLQCFGRGNLELLLPARPLGHPHPQTFSVLPRSNAITKIVRRPSPETKHALRHEPFFHGSRWSAQVQKTRLQPRNTRSSDLMAGLGSNRDLSDCWRFSGREGAYGCKKRWGLARPV